MIHIARWKAFFILAVCVLALLYSGPNMLNPVARAWMQDHLPAWLPTKTVNLGLDLQGGSHLLLQVDVGSVVKERTEGLADSVRMDLREEKIHARISPIPTGIRLQLMDGAQADAVKKVLRNLDNELNILVGEDGTMIEAIFSDVAIKKIKDQTVGQSIEIVRRRVDETGTREPTIQRQGEDRIIVQVPGLDDPQRLKDLLGKTAKLTFHLVDTDFAGGGRRAGTRTLPMLGEPGRSLTIMRREMLTGDMLTNAQPTFQQGQPVISFQLNGIGARRFCDVTRKNVNRPFAIVLDGQVISAPNIREPICGGSAVISGAFTIQEVNDTALLLRAGALPAPLTVLEERTVGPSLGADSVEAGKIAALFGLVFILIFMAASYGLFGMMANVALLVNMALIFALLSGLQATLTLPGIAGIVLTVGMAVDANVLIFERIKEEISGGRSVMAAVNAGYSRAMATIIDSNLTTLIAAVILYSFGTGPIKGFAVTLGIGIITSFFSAIMVTRLMVVTWLQRKKPDVLKI